MPIKKSVQVKKKKKTYKRENLYNSIQFFIIYVQCQQLQSQLQKQHSVDTGNYIKDKHNIKTTATYNNSIQCFIS
jgi:hypothetical protein